MIPNFVACLSIVGAWQFAGLLLEGQYMPPPNPNLVVRFEFSEPDMISHLKWYRTDEDGFCERKADYTFKDSFVWQKVTWLNPANERSCSSDPDMQMGKETTTEVVCDGPDQMGLKLDLDGKELIYLLKRVAPDSTPSSENSIP